MDVRAVGEASETPERPNRAVFAGNFENFLKLLTTQLRQQDPLAPMDSETFTQQLVQFAGVEQALRANERLDALIETVRMGQLLTAAGYVGRQVELAGEELFLPAEGEARIAYVLPETAASVRLRVLDGQGRVVHERDAPVAAGRHLLLWDGRGDDGQRLEPGSYRVEVTALDAEGAPIEAQLRTFGVVDAVRFDEQTLLLSVNGVLHPVSSVLAVSPAPASSS